jgi:phage shock protein A
LSETQLQIRDLKAWLEEQTRSILNPVQDEAKDLRDEMRQALETETEACKLLLDNSNREIEHRNMRVYGRARALNKLARLFLERMKKITIPDLVSYDLLNRFAQDTQRVFIVADMDIKNWFPRISPFFIIDRRKFLAVHEKAKLTLSTLNDFVTKEYVKTKTIEETFQLVDVVQTLERQLSEIKTQKTDMENEKAPLEKEIADLQRKISELETQGPVDELNLVEAEKETLTNELRYALRHLQKPFIKMQALATGGGGAGLTPDEFKALNLYIENPLDAFAAEPSGYPTLKEILQKLSRRMEEDKLKLKSDKARKAVQSIDEILMKDSLVELQNRAADIVVRRTQLLTSAKMDEIRRDISAYQDQLKQLTARKTSVETHEAVKEQAETDIQDRIRSSKRSIEKNVQSFLGKKIEVL